jgi:hypothetical protein
MNPAGSQRWHNESIAVKQTSALGRNRETADSKSGRWAGVDQVAAVGVDRKLAAGHDRASVKIGIAPIWILSDCDLRCPSHPRVKPRCDSRA